MIKGLKNDESVSFLLLSGPGTFPVDLLGVGHTAWCDTNTLYFILKNDSWSAQLTEHLVADLMQMLWMLKE